jgi:hypothetical protein
MISRNSRYGVALFTLLVPFLTLQAGILDKKAIKGVKKVALISVYSEKKMLLNRRVPGPGTAFENVDPAVGGGERVTEQPEKELEALYQFSFKMFEDRLNHVPGWELVPFSAVASSPAYRNFMKDLQAIPKPKENMASSMMGFDQKKETPPPPLDLGQFRSAPGMHVIPITLLTEPGTTYYGNDPYKPQKDVVKKLCDALKVDAVAIVHVRPSFRFGRLVQLTVNEDVKGKARTGSNLFVMDKEGKVVVNTGDIVSKMQEDFESPSLSLIRNGKLLLDKEDVKKGFQDTVVASADKMQEVLVKAFQKLK